MPANLETFSIGNNLHLHFQQDLASYADALHAWCEHLLYMASGPVSVDNLRQRLAKGVDLPYAIAVEVAELQQVVASACTRGSFVSVRTTHEIEYALSPARRATLEEVARQRRSLEVRVRAQWFKELQQSYPELTELLLEELWDGLSRFIPFVVRDLRNRFSEANSQRSDFASFTFPSNEALRKVAEVAFPRFLVSENDDYRAYFTHYLAHALYAFRTAVSREAAEALKGNLAGRVLYLDTNVLLPALGLTGDPSHEEGVRGILQLARKAGLKILVTERTVEEYAAAFRLFRERAHADSAPDYVVRRQTPSIDRAYFIQRSSDFRSVHEFYARFNDVRVLLLDALANPVRIAEEGLSDTERAQVEGSALYTDAFDRLSAITDKPHLAARHDAFHLALVAYRRKRDTWRDTNGWFLTQDRALASVEKGLGWSTPLSMTLDTWVLTFRPLLPRVKDFEEFFAAVVTRQIFPSFYLSPDAVHLFASLATSDTNWGAQEVLARFVSVLPSPALTFQPTLGLENTSELVKALEEMNRQVDSRHRALQSYSTEKQKEDKASSEKERAALEEAVRELRGEVSALSQQAQLDKAQLEKSAKIYSLKQRVSDMEAQKRAHNRNSHVIASLICGLLVFALVVVAVLRPTMVAATLTFLQAWSYLVTIIIPFGVLGLSVGVYRIVQLVVRRLLFHNSISQLDKEISSRKNDIERLDIESVIQRMLSTED